MKKIAAGAAFAAVSMGFMAQSAWALLPIEHWRQSSGAEVWLVRSPGIPMVDVQLAFDAGSRRDPQAQAGLASAVAMMASKGVRAEGQGGGDSPALDENGLGQAWADLGASFGASAARDSFTYSLRSLTEPDLLKRSIALAARQVATPSWPEAVWQRDRERWAASLKEADTRPGTVVAKAFRKEVYGSHPYGYQTTGETLGQIDIAAMKAFHRGLIAACRAKVGVVGAVSREQADTLVKQLLAPLQAVNGDNSCSPLPPVAAVATLGKPVTENIPFQSAQAHVLIGQPGIARNSPDFLAVLVGNHILGGGGFTSRLTEQVREKRGLSYSVYSDFSPGLDRGAFLVALQTRPDQAAEAVKVSQEVIRQFVAEGPTEKELQAAKANLIGGFALRMDSNSKLLGNVANIAWNGRPLDYLEHWTDRVQALSVKDVRAAMQRMLQPERMVTVIVGAKP
jgi:zinc protease